MINIFSGHCDKFFTKICSKKYFMSGKVRSAYIHILTFLVAKPIMHLNQFLCSIVSIYRKVIKFNNVF